MTPGNARQKFIAAAQSYLGTSYRYGGLDRRGIDCSGLVFASFRDALNITAPRTTGGLFSWAEKITSEELQPGDLVFFITVGSAISHVGIYTGGGQFIHAPSEGTQTGVMYSSLDESYWRRTFAGAGRALPPDSGANAPSGPGDSDYRETPADSGLRWAESTGLFFGFGITAGPGGFVDGSLFRGMGFSAKAGYKGLFSDSFLMALEFRPEWDRFLGVWRLPLTLSFGGDILQVFAGPAVTLGDPRIKLDDVRTYYPGFSWLGEIGFSLALKPVPIAAGALSFFMETAWQPYFTHDKFNLFADIAANLRISAGLRYLWLAS